MTQVFVEKNPFATSFIKQSNYFSYKNDSRKRALKANRRAEA